MILALPLRSRFFSLVEMASTVFQNSNLGNILKIMIALVVVGVIAITWTFYHALRLVCDVLTLLTVCFAAIDSAGLVFKGSKDFYIKRLSFWVLLQIWKTFSQVPILGSCLTLATPIAFSLFFLAGDHLLRWLLI